MERASSFRPGEEKDIPLGDVVDAVGFASDQEYAPSLREALLFDTHYTEAKSSRER